MRTSLSSCLGTRSRAAIRRPYTTFAPWLVPSLWKTPVDTSALPSHALDLVFLLSWKPRFADAVAADFAHCREFPGMTRRLLRQKRDARVILPCRRGPPDLPDRSVRFRPDTSLPFRYKNRKEGTRPPPAKHATPAAETTSSGLKSKH